ncbi:hypothetical protein ACIBO2_31875 [Nonomuraea sp. NPDC050022]|uniref:ABC transporter permease subunit n=1 Tax=Nonomuraea sp. NPDC050022 TaxID=3364358 RepID=UPI003788809A
MICLAGPRALALLPAGRLWPLLALAGGLLTTVLTLPEGTGLLSGGTVSAALALTSPVALAALGGVWAERAGVVNIGLEAMMILGTWGAAFGALRWGAVAGLVLGAACGALGGLLHALTTVTLGVDHIVAGVAINLLAPRVSKYLSSIALPWAPGRSTSPPSSVPCARSATTG